MYHGLALPVRAADEWVLTAFWSLAGLDMTLWVLAKGGVLWSADLLNVLMSM
jgi:hypothetical protein